MSHLALHPQHPARDLADELEGTRARLAEAEATLAAIRNGEVDALVVAGPSGEQVFSLQGAETPYRSLVEQMHEGALLLVPDGTILYANARCAALAGKPLEQLIGSAWRHLFAAAEHPRLNEFLTTGRSAGAREEFQLQLESGDCQPVEISLSPLQLDRVEALAAIITDLSERKAAEALLLAANEQLEARVAARTLELTQANESLRIEMDERQRAEQALRESEQRFRGELEHKVRERTARLNEMVAELEHLSYAIVHDMRAPLRAMEGFALLLREEPQLSPAEREDYTSRIASSAARLDRLLQDVLTYNKAVLQFTPLAPVNLSKLIPTVLETYPNLHPEKADIRALGALPVVLGNESLLIQCFSNLLGNAVKFVPPNTRPSVRIWAGEVQTQESVPPPSTIRIWIQDNGIGIPQRAQHRLFGMFQKLHSGYDGTGVGLALVRKVVERMGGKVGAEPGEGKGTRFWVELPLASGPNLAGARNA